MLVYLIYSFCMGCLFMITISSIISDGIKKPKIHFSFLQNKYSKTCRNCNFFIPCVGYVGKLSGGCQKCTMDTFHFTPDMTCGHFEYTDAIQTEINKNLLEKCFKK